MTELFFQSVLVSPKRTFSILQSVLLLPKEKAGASVDLTGRRPRDSLILRQPCGLGAAVPSAEGARVLLPGSDLLLSGAQRRLV